MVEVKGVEPLSAVVYTTRLRAYPALWTGNPQPSDSSNSCWSTEHPTSAGVGRDSGWLDVQAMAAVSTGARYASGLLRMASASARTDSSLKRLAFDL